ncbi:MAG: DUF423 domain-containing protein [Gammaproteobacteria bacterium]|nr:DUF423 domain-containing protein [Gammaproteobacteria bacterium]
MNPRFFLISGLVFMILAVSLGAFGAHALKTILSSQQIQLWKTATDYHFYHALGLIALGIWTERTKLTRLMKIAGILLILGLLLFCGSLYLLALTGITQLGMVTPIGGVFFISGWLFWLIAVIKSRD